MAGLTECQLSVDETGEEETWEIAAYVRSIAGMAPKSAAPGRDDEMKNAQPRSSAGNKAR